MSERCTVLVAMRVLPPVGCGSPVLVGLEARGIRRGDGNPDSVALVEDERRAPQVHLQLIDLARLERLVLFITIAERDAADAVGDQKRFTVRMDVAELDREIGVQAVGRDEEPGRDPCAPGLSRRPPSRWPISTSATPGSFPNRPRDTSTSPRSTGPPAPPSRSTSHSLASGHSNTRRSTLGRSGGRMAGSF